MSYSIDKTLIDNFELLRNIVRPKSVDDKLMVDMSKINNIIDVTIPETLKGNAPDDFYELYSEFKSENEKFKNFILFDKLIGKNIVALGGGFSSGKSSFINGILEKRILPEDIDPSTSVPTYILNGDKYETVGINIFNSKVLMKPIDIRKIAHGFGKITDEENDEENITESVTLGHILENIFFSTNKQKYENIAFLDTPGYSKPDTKEYSTRTDETIARNQLNASNFIIWFVQADSGTITEEDIKFIKTLREDIPKLIILNKADKKNVKDLKDIVSKIKSTLILKGIRFIDVLTFSNRIKQYEEIDEELYSFVINDINKIKKQFDDWNKKKYKSSFALNFKKIFFRCKLFYENQINEEGRKLNRINTSLTKISAEDIEYDVIEPLESLVREYKERLNKLRKTLEDLKNIQNEFFTEIKKISDKVGIYMPEPSEIDLISDNVLNSMEILEQYKDRNGIKTKGLYINLFEKEFENINPLINRCAGGIQYKNEIAELLKENSCKDITDIKLNVLD